jgi:hypothetical protein
MTRGGFHDAPCRKPVAEDMPGRIRVRFRPGRERFAGRVENGGDVEPDKLRLSRGDGFRALGRLAHDEGRNPKRRGLFDHAAGVGDDERSFREHPDEIRVIERIQQMHVRQPRQNPENALPHPRVQVNRIDEFGLGMKRGDFLDRHASLRKRRAPALPPMEGHEHRSAFEIDPGERPGNVFGLRDLAHRQKERIHHGVAHHEDVLGDPFLLQVGGGRLRVREMKLRQMADERPADLLGERRLPVVAPEARLDVPDRNLADARRERGGKRAHGIALDEYHVRPVLGIDAGTGSDDPGSDLRERLAVGHQVEIDVRMESEKFEELIHHLPVLGRHAHLHIKRAVLFKRPDDRRELDDLRSRPKNKQQRFPGLLHRSM